MPSACGHTAHSRCRTLLMTLPQSHSWPSREMAAEECMPAATLRTPWGNRRTSSGCCQALPICLLPSASSHLHVRERMEDRVYNTTSSSSCTLIHHLLWLLPGTAHLFATVRIQPPARQGMSGSSSSRNTVLHPDTTSAVAAVRHC